MYCEIETENVQMHCRTCLNLIKGNKYSTNELRGSLLQFFRQCTREVQGEFLPEFLCFRCYWRLKSFDEFMETCEKSNQYLEQLFKNKDNEALTNKELITENNIADAALDEQEIVNMLLEENQQPTDVLAIEKFVIKEEDLANDSDATMVEVIVENKQEITAKLKSRKTVDCKVCKRKLSAGALSTHMRIHSKHRPFQCEKCERGFNVACRLKQHMDEVHCDIPLEIVCKFGCGSIFQRTETAAAHYRNKHGARGRSSTVAEAKKFNKQLGQSVGLQPFENELKTDDSNLVQTAHNTEDDCDNEDRLKAVDFLGNTKDFTDFESNQCPKTTTRVNLTANVTSEINKFSSAQNEPVLSNKKFENKTLKHKPVCKFCQRSYSNIYSLKLHMITHSKKRLFQCEQCERSFNIRSRLKHHIDEEHGETPIEISCKFGCGQIFRRTETATAHYRNKHNGSIKSSTGFELGLNQVADQTEYHIKKTDLLESNVRKLHIVSVDTINMATDLDPNETNVVNETYKQANGKNEQELSAVKQKPLVCKLCKHTYSSVSALKLHMVTHSKDRPYQCNLCERGFNIQSRLKHHMKEEHGETPLEIVCKFGCGQIFRRTETATAHYRNKHGARDRSAAEVETELNEQLACLLQNENECDDDDKLKGNIDNFPKTFGSTTCRICFKNCASKTTLRIHMRYHLDEKPFQCEKCGCSFRVKSRLNRHMNEVHAEAGFSIVCKYGCGKTFKCSETAWTHHRVKHTNFVPNDRSQVCEHCGKVCRNISHLKDHILQHKPLEESPYCCSICGRRFRSRKCMSRHMERRHEAVRKYQCSFCDVRKATKELLNQHVNTHTKAKKYPCNFCSKIFYNSENLRRHKLNIHLGIKKYRCRHCEMSFVKLNERTSHEEIHKKVE